MKKNVNIASPLRQDHPQLVDPVVFKIQSMVLVVRRVPLRSVVAHHPLALVLSGRDEGLHLGGEPPAVLPVPAVRDARLVLLEQSGEQNLRERRGRELADDIVSRPAGWQT